MTEICKKCGMPLDVRTQEIPALSTDKAVMYVVAYGCFHCMDIVQDRYMIGADAPEEIITGCAREAKAELMEQWRRRNDRQECNKMHDPFGLRD